MAKRKKSLSSSDDSSSSSSDSDSSSSESPRHRRTKLKDHHKSTEKVDRGTVKSKVKEKVDDKRKRSPQTRTSDRKRRHSESQTKQKSSTQLEGSKTETKKRNKSSEKSHRERSRKDRSKSPKADKKKNLFPIVAKGEDVSLELESGKKNITETTLVSYPNLNKSVTEDRTKSEDDRKRRHSSPQRFKSMSSTITVTHNPEQEKRPRRSPVQRSPVQRSLRDRVGWDPFQGTNSSSFGDHDDRQLSRGYTDSYTRKEFGRGRGRGRGRGFRSDTRPRMGGGMWSNNRNFSRNNQENTDRSGINDKKWKRDLFSDD